jgi:G:T-mismatch repair DNA endonuclease (very short patch repair protein)
MIVRRSLHSIRFPYKLHDKSLPCKPDIACQLPGGYKPVIFVQNAAVGTEGQTPADSNPTNIPDFCFGKIN